MFRIKIMNKTKTHSKVKIKRYCQTEGQDQMIV